jgi:hypothetical protein
MLNLFQHLIDKPSLEILKQVQDDRLTIRDSRYFLTLLITISFYRVIKHLS